MSVSRETRELLSAEAVLADLGTRVVGSDVVYYRETTSTNDQARLLARAGAPDGTVVLTDFQVAGRGRLARRWQAPPGSSLLLSLLLRPRLPAGQVQRLTMICGLSMAEAIESETGLRVGLKWPNDVVCGGRKLGGILTETELTGDRVESVVVGIGINVNLDPVDLGDQLRAPATSLAQVLGGPVKRLPLLKAFLRSMDESYGQLKVGWSPHQAWVARLVTLGKQVSVTSFGKRLEGTAETVDSDGHLVLRLPDGRRETVVAGDVIAGRRDD